MTPEEAETVRDETVRDQKWLAMNVPRFALWIPREKPKPGFEAEMAEIHAVIDRARGGAGLPIAERENLRDRMRAIGVTPEETIGAPKVGESKAAADWWMAELSKCRDEGRFPDDGTTPEGLILEFKDKRVVQLTDYEIQAPAGFENSLPTSIEVSSFYRELYNKRLVAAVMVDGWLRTPKKPDEMLEFASLVENAARGRRTINCQGAVRWLRFWAERRHGLVTWVD